MRSKASLGTIKIEEEDWLLIDVIISQLQPNDFFGVNKAREKRVVIAISPSGQQRMMIRLEDGFKGNVLVSEGVVVAASEDGWISTPDRKMGVLSPGVFGGRAIAFSALKEEVTVLSYMGGISCLRLIPEGPLSRNEVPLLGASSG